MSNYYDDMLMRPAMSFDEFCRWASIDRHTADREIAQGNIEVRKRSRQISISFSAALRWLHSLPANTSASHDDIRAYTAVGS